MTYPGRWSEQDRQTIDDALGLPGDDLPHYPNQADADTAAAAAGLLVILFAIGLFAVGVVIGFVIRAVLG